MSAATAATEVIAKGITKFQDARSQARKFHAEDIGTDVDPDYCFADFLTCIARSYEPFHREQANAISRLDKVYGAQRSKTAMSVSAGGPAGGYLVPQELAHSLMVDVAEESIFRSRALVQPMTSATLLLPLPDAETVPPNAVSPFFGGIQMLWHEEANLSETEPLWRQVELRANDLSGYALVSKPMQDDAGAPLESFLRRLFARSVAWFEDFSFLRGSGVGQPLGMVNAGSTFAVTRSAHNVIAQADVAGMIGKLLPYSYVNALWGVSPTAMVQLVEVTGWVPNEGDKAQGRAIGALYGRAIIPTEKLPALGTSGDLFLFDPTLYVIGDRQAVEIDLSYEEPTAFLKHQVVWRIIERVDGRPWFDKGITIADTATIVYPSVMLTAP